MKKKNYCGIAILMAAMLMLSGCGASKTAVSEASCDSGAGAWASDDAMAEESYSMAQTEEMDLETADELMVDEAGGTAGSDRPENTGRKLIKRQYVTMETKEFDDLTSFIRNKVTEVGGYIEYSDITGTSYSQYSNRYASYTLRIPVTELDGFVTSLKEAGNVTDFSESVEDITLSYVDTESRISALKTEQESLMQMLKQSGDLDTLLAIQSRLTEVRYQLESYESQLRVFDNDINYSTVSVDVREVERETIVEDNSFGSQLKERLSSSFYRIGQGFKSAALFILGGLPYWILLAVVVVVIVLIIKRHRRKRRAAEMLMEKPMEMPMEMPAEEPKEETDQMTE